MLRLHARQASAASGGDRRHLPAVCCGAVIFAALDLGIFDKMLLRFSSDKGSALARFATFNLLSHFDWQELILGPNPVRVNALQAQLGLNYGIENFWISCIVQFGIIHTVLLTIGLVCFFVELLRRSSRRRVGDCSADHRHRRQFGELLVKNIQLAQFAILISVLLPREQRRVAAPRKSLHASTTAQFRHNSGSSFA